MFATGADHPSEPATLGTGRPIPTIVRGVLARRKSMSALLYMISAGLIATWIIGVFFGLGFFLLTHETRRTVSDTNVIDQPVPSSETPRSVQNAARRPTDLPVRSDQPVPATSGKPPSSPGKEAGSSLGNSDRSGPGRQDQNAIANPPPQLTAPEPERVQTGIDRDKGPPAVDIGPTLGFLGDAATAPVPRSPSSGVIEQRRASPHATESHKRRHQSPARRAPAHPPVQAIQDVLHKHARLLK
jgi:hypothetical protein